MVGSFREPPRLRIRDHNGTRPLPAGDRIGDPRRPATSWSGWLAFQFVGRNVPRRWLAGTAIADEGGELIDLVPGALPTASPAWSPDGTHIARIATDQTGGRALELIELSSGDTQTIHESPNLTAVAWNTPDSVTIASGEYIESLDLLDGRTTELHKWDTARQLLRYGTDDLYPIVSHIAVSNERIILEVRWHRSGRASTSSIYSLTPSGLSYLPKLEGYRTPYALPDGRVQVCTDDRVVILDDDVRSCQEYGMPGLIDASSIRFH